MPCGSEKMKLLHCQGDIEWHSHAEGRLDTWNQNS